MAEMLMIIAIHYGCSEIAINSQMTQNQLVMCAQAYERTKRLFLKPNEILAMVGNGDEMTPEQHRETYLRFKTWEMENPETVARLKRSVLGEAA